MNKDSKILGPSQIPSDKELQEIMDEFFMKIETKPEPKFKRGDFVFSGIDSCAMKVINSCGVKAPTLYEAQKWLREEKKIGVFVSGFKNGYTFWINNLLNGDTLYQGFFDNETGEKYKSYEEALLEGIKEAVKILKEN